MQEPERKRQRPRRTAVHAMVDFLSRRDHSEKELKQKLSKRFPPNEVAAALEFAYEHELIAEPQRLASTLADQWNRRKLGALKIRKKLMEKGLPSVATDSELELEKALELAHTRRDKMRPSELEDSAAAKAKIGRFLISRGFQPAIVRKVIYEKLK